MFALKWEKEGLGRKLNPNEIRILSRNLAKEAEKSRTFHIQMIPPEITWVRENISNAYLKVVTSDTDDGSTWCIVGVDEESVMHEYNKI